MKIFFINKHHTYKEMGKFYFIIIMFLLLNLITNNKIFTKSQNFPTAYILEVKDNEVTINLGSNYGVKTNMIFKVEKEKVNLDGQLETIYVGKIKVKKVNDYDSIADIIEKKRSIEEGDRVSFVEEEREEKIYERTYKKSKIEVEKEKELKRGKAIVVGGISIGLVNPNAKDMDKENMKSFLPIGLIARFSRGNIGFAMDYYITKETKYYSEQYSTHYYWYHYGHYADRKLFAKISRFSYGIILQYLFSGEGGLFIECGNAEHKIAGSDTIEVMGYKITSQPFNTKRTIPYFGIGIILPVGPDAYEKQNNDFISFKVMFNGKQEETTLHSFGGTWIVLSYLKKMSFGRE